MPDANINQYHPASGRFLKENSEYVNIADLLQMAFGLPYAALNGEAGIFTCEIAAGIGETCALNIFFDNKTVVSKVILPENNLTPITSEGLATWEANGAVVKIISNDGTSDVYDIRYVIKRTHKAR